MLASTIQFTTNPPTPTPHHPHKAAEHGSGNQGALPQNPDSMPPPHTQGHPPPADHHDHNSRSSPPERACLLCQHQAANHPGPHHTGRKPEHQPVTQTTQRAARKPNSAPQWPHHKPGNMTFHP